MDITTYTVKWKTDRFHIIYADDHIYIMSGCHHVVVSLCRYQKRKKLQKNKVANLVHKKPPETQILNLTIDLETKIKVEIPCY